MMLKWLQSGFGTETFELLAFNSDSEYIKLSNVKITKESKNMTREEAKNLIVKKINISNLGAHQHLDILETLGLIKFDELSHKDGLLKEAEKYIGSGATTKVDYETTRKLVTLIGDMVEVLKDKNAT